MNNISHNKIWRTGALQIHMESTPIPLIKSKNDDKSDKDSEEINCISILLQKNSIFMKFKTPLFDKVDPEEFLLFVSNFQLTLKDSVALAASAKTKYLCTLLRGEALCQLDTLYVEVGSMNTTHLNRIFLGLGMYC